MLIRKDLIAHAVIGLLAIAYSAIVLWLVQHYGYGPAAAFASTTMGIALELYQKVRHEGTPDAWDAIATASPGWVLWIALANIPALGSILPT